MKLKKLIEHADGAYGFADLLKLEIILQPAKVYDLSKHKTSIDNKRKKKVLEIITWEGEQNYLWL